MVGPPLDMSTSSLGKEMAFLIMGETGGGGGERSLDPPRGLGSEEPLLICRRVLEKKAPILLSGLEIESVSLLFPLAEPP